MSGDLEVVRKALNDRHYVCCEHNRSYPCNCGLGLALAALSRLEAQEPKHAGWCETATTGRCTCSVGHPDMRGEQPRCRFCGNEAPHGMHTRECPTIGEQPTPPECSTCGQEKNVQPCVCSNPFHLDGEYKDGVRVQPTPRWRVGSKVLLNVYEGDRSVCQCHSEDDARRIVAAMNATGKPAPPFTLYRGECGHFWDSLEIGIERCPACREHDALTRKVEKLVEALDECLMHAESYCADDSPELAHVKAARALLVEHEKEQG